ncbi:hypothetical protein HDU98_007455 [Podochytrium sp. JEL0797]|nr:hypothetical protein HDU98_007455 [Podochytrium sp. JEL0797]
MCTKTTLHTLLLAAATLAATFFSIWRSSRVFHASSIPTPAPTPTSPPFPLATRPEGSHALHFHIPTTGCPTPKLALIGILTVPDAQATDRRNALRRVHETWNDAVPEHARFEFQYVFGTPGDVNETVREGKVKRIEEERVGFPGSVVMLDIKENMNSGKTLAWFNYSRSLAYTVHPTLEGEYCPRYLHIGKGDDDTLIHIPRLSRHLSILPTQGKPNYVGMDIDRFATGMLYFLSTSLVEYIVMQDGEWARQHATGHEDRVTGKFVQHADVEVNTVSDREVFHDHPVFITHRSAVVHRVKKVEDVEGVVARLYEESDALERVDAVRRYCAEKGFVVKEGEWVEVMQRVDKLVGNEWGNSAFIDRIVKDVIEKRGA